MKFTAVHLVLLWFLFTLACYAIALWVHYDP